MCEISEEGFMRNTVLDQLVNAKYQSVGYRNKMASLNDITINIYSAI